MISTLLQATEGDAIVAGHSILTEPDMVRKSITYLPDEAGAYKTMTGREYLEFMASIYADKGEQAYVAVRYASLVTGLTIKYQIIPVVWQESFSLQGR